jgi:hypothetical protein
MRRDICCKKGSPDGINNDVFASEQMGPVIPRKTVINRIAYWSFNMKQRLTPRHAIVLLAAALCWSGSASAATAEAKAAYVQAKDGATAAYKANRAKCDAITGAPKDVCVAEAKAARVRAEEEAGAYYKNTLKAYTSSRMKIADANYDLDKAKCGALAGNDRDVCVSQAKATLIAAQADAKADKRAIEARTDARDDKRAAQYKVAMEKCDAFAGAVKDSCVATAKLDFGK